MEKLLRQESDSRIQQEFSATLREVPTKALLDYLRYLIQVGDLSRIQSVCGVFSGRDDRQRYKVAFDSMLSQFAFAESGALRERVVRIRRSAEKVDERVAALFCGDGAQRSRAPAQPAQIAALSQNGSSPAFAGEAAIVGDIRKSNPQLIDEALNFASAERRSIAS